MAVSPEKPTTVSDLISTLSLFAADAEVPPSIAEMLTRTLREAHAASRLTFEDLKPYIPATPYDRIELLFSHVFEVGDDSAALFVRARFFNANACILDGEEHSMSDRFDGSFAPLQSRMVHTPVSALCGKLIWDHFAPDVVAAWKPILVVGTAATSRELLGDGTVPFVEPWVE